MAATSILVIGNAVLDIILGVDHFPAEDEEMRAHSRRTNLGGNAANTARVLAGLGHATSLMATLAPDADGEALRRLLMEAGVDTRHVVTAPDGSTPVSTILLHAANGSRTIVHHRNLAELDFDGLRDQSLRHHGWIHFEGRNVDQVARMITRLRDSAYAGRISVEIEKDRPGIETLAGLADLVLFSRAYAQAHGFTDAPALLTGMRPLSTRAVMTCTWGEAGAWALEGNDRMHHCPAFAPSRVVDTVGAGDVFNAGMIHGLAGGMGVPQALADATRLAGRKVGQWGFDALAGDDVSADAQDQPG